MGSSRVHIVVAAQERAQYRAAAEREGVTLSTWFRSAARERLAAQERPRISTPAELNAFFAECDALHTDDGTPEPDWHLTARSVDSERVSAANPPP